jgi:hypothetical protein
MSYTTRLTGYSVFDEHSATKLVNDINHSLPGGERFFSGYRPRDFAAAPFGTYSAPFALDLIPRNEWAERAEALDAAKATPEHLATFYKVPILNQKTLPYCWCYGVVGAMATSYAQSGTPIGYLSATSAAAKIKNYVKLGGWAGEAIEGIQRFGVSSVEHWPEAVLDRRYDTAEQRENAQMHKAVEFEELPSQSFDAVATALLSGFPVTLGLNWWGHLVFATRLVVLGRGSYGVIIRNSWGDDWENKGRAVLTEARATPHEAFSIRSVTKYETQRAA